MLNVDEQELRDLKWWHDFHKNNLTYLVMRLEEYFAGADHLLPIIKSELIGYSMEYTGLPRYGPKPEQEDE